MSKKVWIDAGHGGKDPGATANGLQEKDIVLKLSQGVQKQLEAEYEGVEVLMSRSTDVFLELSKRTNKANRAGADILVSIHCNAAGGSGGFESFRFTNAMAASVALQNSLHREIIAALKPYGVNDRGQKSANLHMIRESKMPAVLTENLFVDVEKDAGLLKRQEVLDAIIQGHVTGIVKHLRLRKRAGAIVSKGESNINIVSPWAAEAWEVMTNYGFYDGKRPGSTITREESAVVLYRFRDHIDKMLKESLIQIEKNN